MTLVAGIVLQVVSVPCIFFHKSVYSRDLAQFVDQTKFLNVLPPFVINDLGIWKVAHDVSAFVVNLFGADWKPKHVTGGGHWNNVCRFNS